MARTAKPDPIRKALQNVADREQERLDVQRRRTRDAELRKAAFVALENVARGALSMDAKELGDRLIDAANAILDFDKAVEGDVRSVRPADTPTEFSRFRNLASAENNDFVPDDARVFASLFIMAMDEPTRLKALLKGMTQKGPKNAVQNALLKRALEWALFIAHNQYGPINAKGTRLERVFVPEVSSRDVSSVEAALQIKLPAWLIRNSDRSNLPWGERIEKLLDELGDYYLARQTRNRLESEVAALFGNPRGQRRHEGMHKAFLEKVDKCSRLKTVALQEANSLIDAFSEAGIDAGELRRLRNQLEVAEPNDEREFHKIKNNLLGKVDKLNAAFESGDMTSLQALKLTQHSRDGAAMKKGRRRKTTALDRQIAADWEQAKNAGIGKKDFCKGKHMPVRNLDRILDRIRPRKK